MSLQQIKRRAFIAALGGTAAWLLPARTTKAQDAGHMPRVGWIWHGSAAGNPPEVAGFKQGLRELGYVEGRNIVVEYRFGELSEARMPELAADLARLNVSVIWAGGMDAIRAVQRAAPDTPIVFITADPIGAGVVSNLRRPGGNITGVSLLRLGGKWPELAKEVLPGLSRVGYILNPANASSATNLAEARRSAEALGLEFRSYPIVRPEDRQRAFDAMTRDGIGFLLLDAAHPYGTDWPRVAELALRHKLPAISEIRESWPQVA
jgi:putative ABC transport system substrate-binding protein